MDIFCSTQEFDSLCREIAGKADLVRLQVKGGSMEPFIRSGDWVNAALCRGAKCDIGKGGIILFKKGESLYMHRVIRIGKDGFITKGDMSFGDDGLVTTSDVLARVISVERGGRLISLSSRPSRLAGAIAAEMSVIMQYPMLFTRKICALGCAALSWVQGLKIYRLGIKKILGAAITVRDAAPDDEGDLRDLYLMAGHDIRDGIAKMKSEGFWLVAERKGKIVGGLTISRYEKDIGLRVIFGLEVKPRFRGLGIGEELVRRAMRKAGEERAKEIGLFVNKRAAPAIKLYRKLGFNVTDNFPGDFNRSVDELYLAYRLDRRL
jgi:ribosomal protein S18 acetylase RimI-like enzyme